MQLEHSFTVPVPVAQAWKVLLDIEQIAPCMPGAVLDTIDGDDFTGRVKVKLGPISLTYKGKASFVKKDEATHTAVIDAAGKDQRGNGTAAATVTATLKDQGDSTTRVEVLTDLNITGKPAQFGRGVMVDVGNKLIGQFANCVEGKLSATDGAAEAGSGSVSVEVAADGAASAAGTDEGSDEAAHGRHAAEMAAEAAARAAGAGTNAAAKSTAPAKSAAAANSTASAKSAAAANSAADTPAAAPTATAARPRAVPSREPEPINLLEMAGGSVVTRIGIPAAGLAAAVGILFYIIRKIRS